MPRLRKADCTGPGIRRIRRGRGFSYQEEDGTKIDDPRLCLLKVSVEQAEYWDAPSSKIVQLFGFVKALATGQEADYGENKKIQL